jgi:DNA-binding MarR family transcriptional regulator
MQVMATAKRWKLRIAHLFKEAGHTGAPMMVLYHLAAAPSGLIVSELANRMELSGGALTRLLHRLERDSMISRHRLVGDGRTRLVKLEQAGRVAMEIFDIQVAAMRDQLFRGLSDGDLATTLHVLEVLMERLGAAEDNPYKRAELSTVVGAP